MKVVVVGYRKNYFEKEIKREKKLKLVKISPDVVVAFGGEGTFLYSEMIYPEIPKVFVRHPSKCRKCKKHNYGKIIKALVENRFKVVKLLKIQCSVNGKRLIGLNEINIHYKPPCAMRFDVHINKKLIAKESIGDGLIVSTPYGSSGYFFSIAKKTFNKGLGIAFNNPVKRIKGRIVPENSIIKVKVARGPGMVCVDCDKKIIPLKTGDIVKIQKHSRFARVLKLNGEMKVRI
ncbi:MAG: NAD(+)/NADH kinase [Nanoarchaeota archaeon]|nr:NAD(+)/NADH kinase [Nanoarchaeota archaeon]